jgi:hypothetical protein
VFFNGHGAQFLPFDFFNGFPTIAVELDVEIGVHALIIAPADDVKSNLPLLRF